MKKLCAYLLVVLMVLSFTACANDNGSNSNNDGTKFENKSVSQTDKTLLQTTKEKSNNSKILVAYFSVTNTTKGVAEKIADITGATLYEITPKDPYTAEDIDYNNDKSRTTLEMNDSSVRPEIKGKVDNIEQYDTIFVGYPIWWGEAPRILSTFMESYNFSNKTIVPFCTSASSDIGSSADSLAKLTKGAKWLEGKRFDSSTSNSELKDWISDLNLK